MLKMFLRVAGQVSCSAALTYDYVVIEDENTPLADIPARGNYYAIGVMVFLIVTICVLTLIWFLKWNKLRERLLSLRLQAENDKKKVSLSIRNVKDEIASLEAELSSRLID